MPHVIVKLFTGRTEEQKAKIAQAITAAVMDSAGSSVDAVSVSIEDVAPADWDATVYKPDITDKPNQLYKKPGYAPQA